MGIDGVPLQVWGQPLSDYQCRGPAIDQEMIVADSLTSEGILGLDFLESNQCILDLQDIKLYSQRKALYMW